MTAAQDLPRPELPVGRYRLRFRAAEPVRLPDYAGSTWRGAFGGALKRLACVTGEPQCGGGLLCRACVYSYLFETPPDPAAGKLRKYPAAPHPFVLAPTAPTAPAAGRGVLAPGAEVALFGHGNRYLPYAVHALNQAAQRGVGAGSGRLELTGVEQAGAGEAEMGGAGDGHWTLIFAPDRELVPLAPQLPTLPSCPEELTLAFDTPLRLKGRGRFVGPEAFEFGDLFSNLLRRVSLLTAFHTDTPLETDFAGLTQAARELRCGSRALRWHDWARWSSRQEARVPMGGLLGQATLTGAGLAPFWPYLWLGQWTHAGKGTSMGLGRYRVVAGG